MKKILNLVLLLASVSAAEEPLLQRYETAYRLETEEHKPDEAAKIYRELVSIEASGEDRYAIAQASKRLIVLYRREELCTMDQKIEALKKAPAAVDHIIETFGEPLAFVSLDTVYTKDNLPFSFSMSYPDGFSIDMSINDLRRMKFSKANYIIHGLHCGATKEQVFKVFPPDRIEEDKGQKKITGVAYLSSSSTTISSYTTKYGIGFYFVKDWVFRMHITDIEKLRAYIPPVAKEKE